MNILSIFSKKSIDACFPKQKSLEINFPQCLSDQIGINETFYLRNEKLAVFKESKIKKIKKIELFINGMVFLILLNNFFSYLPEITSKSNRLYHLLKLGISISIGALFTARAYILYKIFSHALIHNNQLKNPLIKIEEHKIKARNFHQQPHVQFISRSDALIVTNYLKSKEIIKIEKRIVAFLLVLLGIGTVLHFHFYRLKQSMITFGCATGLWASRETIAHLIGKPKSPLTFFEYFFENGFHYPLMPLKKGEELSSINSIH